MDPTAPVMSQEYTSALWGLALGQAALWGMIVPALWLIVRWYDRHALRQAQERLRRWDAAHPQEPQDERARLAQIKAQLWLESLAPYLQAHLLRERLAEAERRGHVNGDRR